MECQWNEYNWNATSIVIDGKIMKPNFAWYIILREVSRESASRQPRELIMRSERTTNVQRGGRRESQGRVNLPFV